MQAISRTVLLGIMLVGSLSLTACSSDDDDDDGGSGAEAPASVAGETYAATVESGSGLFATTGSFTIEFSATDDSYVIDGDDTNIADSTGTFDYSASGSTAVLALEDSGAGGVSFELEFDSDTAGSFTGSAESDPDAEQAGSFERQ